MSGKTLILQKEFKNYENKAYEYFSEVFIFKIKYVDEVAIPKEKYLYY